MFFIAILSSMSVALCQAGGFEAPNLTSAKFTGMGGAAVSSIAGAESVFFNPAGLANTGNRELVLDLVLGAAKASSPLVPSGQSATQGADPQTSKLTLIPVANVFG